MNQFLKYLVLILISFALGCFSYPYIFKSDFNEDDYRNQIKELQRGREIDFLKLDSVENKIKDKDRIDDSIQNEKPFIEIEYKLKQDEIFYYNTNMLAEEWDSIFTAEGIKR